MKKYYAYDADGDQIADDCAELGGFEAENAKAAIVEAMRLWPNVPVIRIVEDWPPSTDREFSFYVRSAELMQRAAMKALSSRIPDLRQGGYHKTADMHASAANVIRWLDAETILRERLGGALNSVENIAFEDAAQASAFNTTRNSAGTFTHPITNRAHEVWRAAVRWTQRAQSTVVSEGKRDALHPEYVGPHRRLGDTRPVAPLDWDKPDNTETFF